MLTVPIKQTIAKYARQHPTEEVCGLILKNDTVVAVDNILPEGDINDTEIRSRHNDFLMPSDTLPAMKNEIRAVFHSHWRESSPALLTAEDINVSRILGIPYAIYHVDFDQWDLWDPNGLHPWPLFQKHTDPSHIDFYTGWAWSWGRADCLTVLRSYYKGILNHDIQDFQRTVSVDEFQQRLNDGTWNMYEENLGCQGLVKIYEGETSRFPLQLHDVILMRLQSKIPHHVGIIVNTSPYEMLHHLEPGRLSEVVSYGPARMRQTASVWRLDG